MLTTNKRLLTNEREGIKDLSQLWECLCRIWTAESSQKQEGEGEQELTIDQEVAEQDLPLAQVLYPKRYVMPIAPQETVEAVTVGLEKGHHPTVLEKRHRAVLCQRKRSPQPSANLEQVQKANSTFQYCLKG